MVQHLLLGMLAPLGLVLGAPVTLLLGVLPRPGARRLSAVLRSRPVHLLAHPFTAGVISAGTLYLLYLTPLYAATARDDRLHLLLHLHFLVAGCLFTWSVAGPDPAPRRPGLGVRVAALVLAAAAHSHLAKVLYADASSLPPGAGHDAREVEQAAQWMYYGGDLAELLLACALFSWWLGRTRRRGGRRLSGRAGTQPLGAA